MDTAVYKTAEVKAGDSASFDAVKLFEENKNSVVNIAERMSIAGAALDQTLGTGFMIDKGEKTCRIATDLHVVDKAEKLSVRVPDAGAYIAEIELRDQKNDLAILKIAGEDVEQICKPLALSDSREPVSRGQDVQKLSARMVDPDYTTGKVDEYFRRFQAEALGLLSGEDPQRNMIYVLGPSLSGDSGGPILDGAGRVVGIDSAVGENGFAMTPAYYLKESLDKLKLSG